MPTRGPSRPPGEGGPKTPQSRAPDTLAPGREGIGARHFFSERHFGGSTPPRGNKRSLRVNGKSNSWRATNSTRLGSFFMRHAISVHSSGTRAAFQFPAPHVAAPSSDAARAKTQNHQTVEKSLRSNHRFPPQFARLEPHRGSYSSSPVSSSNTGRRRPAKDGRGSSIVPSRRTRGGFCPAPLSTGFPETDEGGAFCSIH